MSKPKFRFGIKSERAKSANSAERENQVSRWQQNKLKFNMKKTSIQSSSSTPSIHCDTSLRTPLYSNEKFKQYTFEEQTGYSNEANNQKEMLLNRQATIILDENNHNKDISLDRKDAESIVCQDNILTEKNIFSSEVKGNIQMIPEVDYDRQDVIPCKDRKESNDSSISPNPSSDGTNPLTEASTTRSLSSLSNCCDNVDDEINCRGHRNSTPSSLPQSTFLAANISIKVKTHDISKEEELSNLPVPEGWVRRSTAMGVIYSDGFSGYSTERHPFLTEAIREAK